MDVRFIPPGGDISPAAAVRTAVFVEEQGFSAELEFDGIDPVATHVVLYDGGIPVATGRVFPHRDTPGLYVVGRVAVLSSHRGRDLGYRVMAGLEEKARELGGREITLSAQVQARPFYEKNGYMPRGEVYMDEHCPHIEMRKSLH